MSFRSNAFYGDPSIGAIAGNIGAILFGDPQASLRNAQRDYFRARTEEVQRKGAQEAEQRAALGGLGDVFRRSLYETDAPGPNPDGSAGVTVRVPADEARRRFSTEIGNIARAYPNSAEAIANVFSTFGALSGDDGLGRSALIARGQTPGRDFATTAERADAISARDAAEAQAQAEAVANIQGDFSVRRENIQQAGANGRQVVQVFEGIDPQTRLPIIRAMPLDEYRRLPGDQRPQIYVPGVAQVFNTQLRNEGSAANTAANNASRERTTQTRVQGYLDGVRIRDAGQDRRQGADLAFRGEQNDLNRAQQSAITQYLETGRDTRAQLAADTSRANAGDRLAGRLANSRNDNGLTSADTVRLNQSVAETLFTAPNDPSNANAATTLRKQRLATALQGLNDAEFTEYNRTISDAFRQTRDANQAAAAGAMYLRQRFKLEDQAWIGQNWQPVRIQGAPAQAPASLAPRAPATAPADIPPVGAREMNKVYNTPKGPMRWTGTGWLPAPEGI